LITTLSVFSALFIAVYLFLLSYLIIGWARIKTVKTKIVEFSTKVTVMVAARNEEKLIHLTLEDIIAQDYPKHLTEIIFVDDHSTDRTSEIIRQYADRGVKLIVLNESTALNSYKKKAISRAIDESTGELMVATDADCRMGKSWLSTMVNYYEAENPLMIAAPVTYFEERSFFELLQTLEFGFLIGMGAGFIGNGSASHCNGANLAYRKDTFYQVGGFKGIDDVASGDDELLLQKISRQYPGKIGFLKDYDAMVFTHAKHTIGEFMQQRRRWASKSTKYIDKRVTAASISIWLLNVSLLGNFIAGLFIAPFFKIFLVLFILKLLFETAVQVPIHIFFRRAWLLCFMPLLSFIHIGYFVYVGLMGNTSKYTWKGRVVR